MKVCIFLVLAFACIELLAAPKTSDVANSYDHPMITRYPGSIIIHYKQNDFDQVNLPSGPFSYKTKKVDTIAAEGKTTRITYGVPAGRSVFEVYKNYENALNKAGFKPIFQADRKGLVNPHFIIKLVKPDTYCLNSLLSQESERYLLTKLTKNGASTWVSLLVIQAGPSWKGMCHPIGVQLIVVESKAMEDNLVKIDAKAMAAALAETGHIAIYGIYFDTNRSQLKSESDSTLQEIAKLLNEQKSLKLFVVGHTDSVGDFEHNFKLSKDRAASVVTELVSKYKIQSSRLSPYGVGPLSPVQSNKQEKGRSKNRRVELIER